MDHIVFFIDSHYPSFFFFKDLTLNCHLYKKEKNKKNIKYNTNIIFTWKF